MENNYRGRNTVDTVGMRKGFPVGCTVIVHPVDGPANMRFTYQVVANGDRILFLWNGLKGCMQSRPCLVQQADGLWENSSGIRYTVIRGDA